MDKNTTSNVENSRERFEEPIDTYGSTVRVERIWQDTNLVPEVAPSVMEENLLPISSGRGTCCSVKTFKDGATIRKLIYYYKNLQLSRVQGTRNCYYADELEGIMTEDFGETYCPIIYVDGNKLAYGLGKPYFDNAAGTLYFRDKDFAESIYGKAITISYYRYMGRKGINFHETNISLPFRDDIKHFKDAKDDSRTATFKVRGDTVNTKYVLPSPNGKWYDKTTETETTENSGVVVLQENIEDILWRQNVRISGGKWLPMGGVTKVFRYNPQNQNGEQVDEGESEDLNRLQSVNINTNLNNSANSEEETNTEESTIEETSIDSTGENNNAET